MMKKTKPIAK